MSIYQKFQRITPYLWSKYSFTIENLNLNPLLKRYLYDNKACPNFNNKHDYFNYLAKEIIKNNPIQYLEFGVYKGDSIKEWVDLNQNTKSEFFGFDTFKGLPEDWTYTMKKGEFNLQENIPIIDDQLWDNITSGTVPCNLLSSRGIFLIMGLSLNFQL